MSVSYKSLLIAACLLSCQVFAQNTPAATTPAATTPAATTPAATTPSATTPAASTPAASTPAASTPAASTPAATTPAASTPAIPTPTLPSTGWLASWFRPIINGGAAAANSGLGLLGQTVQFKSNVAQRLGSGLIGTAKSLTDMGIGLASDGTTFATGAASRVIGIGEGLANAVPFRPIGAAATMGANVARMGLNAASAGTNIALTAAQTLATAKTGILSSGLRAGTGMISTVGNGAVASAQTGVDTAARMANQLLDSADGVIASGSQMVAQTAARANEALNSANANMQGLAERAKNAVDANLAAAYNGATAAATTPTTASG